MTNSKNTKKSLYASALALLLCFVMLIGTTFAWFTDSASTGVNKIQAGNLDIKFSYMNANHDEYTEVTTETEDLFVAKDGGDILWEPGAASVCYFKVENLGSLALKYIMSVGSQDVVTYNGLGLSSALKTAYVELTEGETLTNDEAIAAATAVNAELILNYTSDEVSLAGKTETTTDTEYFAMVVYMPTDVGNDYNLPTGVEALQTDLYINLVATQLASEYDSFGNDYDADSKYPETVKVTFKPVENQVFEIKGNNISATVPAGATLTKANGTAVVDGDELVLSIVPTSLNDNIEIVAGSKAETFEINLSSRGEKVTSSEPMDIEVNIGKNREGNIELYHNETKIDVKGYDKATGILTFETSNFSPFTVVEVQGPDTSWYDASATTYTLNDAQDLFGFAQLVEENKSFAGKTIKLGKDIDLDGYVWNPIDAWHKEFNANTVIDGDGHSIKNMTVATADNAGFFARNTNNITIKDITFDNAYVKTTENKSTTYGGVVIGYNYAATTFENVKVINSKVLSNWQCGGMMGINSENVTTFVGCTVENTFVGGYNATAGAIFGLGAVEVVMTNCTANKVDLYTDGLQWDSTQKSGDVKLLVGHNYGKALTITDCTVNNVNVVSSYPA